MPGCDRRRTGGDIVRVLVGNLISLGCYVLDPTIMMLLIELPSTIVAIALFVITLGILLRFGDLRVRRSRTGRADGLYEGRPVRLRRRSP